MVLLLWGNPGSNDFLRGVKDRENHWQIDGFGKQDSKAALLSSPRLTAAAKLLPNQYTAARLKSTDNVFCRRRSNMCLICTDWAEGIMGQELGHENRITIQKAKSSLEIRALRYYNDSLK